ncbi:hypothetical protein LCGC14_0906930 [marine sediment metagenome]|uniref:Uncharacterized protein n=1 Tax=marine sediment metagenome TaxID=412755 RepID=A0A0F9S1N9_9ZZZZ
MALIRTGGVVGQISGRLGGDVFSHNRYGSYVRQGTIPVTSTTSYALAAKARMASVSQGWQSLTAAQKLAWNVWATTNPVLNRLGQSVNLTGHAAYVGVNARLSAVSVALITDPPIAAAPAPLTYVELAADIGPGVFEFTFAATPIAAADTLWTKACVLDSTGINFVENYLRFLGGSPLAQASPFDPQTLIETRFGGLVVGQIIVATVSVFDTTTGLLSAPRRCQATVVDTTV